MQRSVDHMTSTFSQQAHRKFVSVISTENYSLWRQKQQFWRTATTKHVSSRYQESGLSLCQKIRWVYPCETVKTSLKPLLSPSCQSPRWSTSKSSLVHFKSVQSRQTSVWCSKLKLAACGIVFIPDLRFRSQWCWPKRFPQLAWRDPRWSCRPGSHQRTLREQTQASGQTAGLFKKHIKFLWFVDVSLQFQFLRSKDSLTSGIASIWLRRRPFVWNLWTAVPLQFLCRNWFSESCKQTVRHPGNYSNAQSGRVSDDAGANRTKE